MQPEIIDDWEDAWSCKHHQSGENKCAWELMSAEDVRRWRLPLQSMGCAHRLCGSLALDIPWVCCHLKLQQTQGGKVLPLLFPKGAWVPRFWRLAGSPCSSQHLSGWWTQVGLGAVAFAFYQFWYLCAFCFGRVMSDLQLESSARLLPPRTLLLPGSSQHYSLGP